jgi:hypothetical protein
MSVAKDADLGESMRAPHGGRPARGASPADARGTRGERSGEATTGSRPAPSSSVLSPVPSLGVLAFERRVVAALTESTEPDRRAAVAAWVDGCLREMPEHLRAGVAAESLALGGWAALRSGFGHHDDVMEGLARSRLTPVRQYVRLFRSLVLFADLELSRPADR